MMLRRIAVLGTKRGGVMQSAGALLLSRRFFSMEDMSSGARDIKYPIVGIPARSFFSRQGLVDINELRRGISDDMLAQLKASRTYYQYPSLSAPSIGWNAQVFTLFDGSVFVNPEIVVGGKALTTADEVWKYKGAVDAATGLSDPECWTWEPCASCPFLMHYIKRPSKVTIRAFDEKGKQFTVTLDKMKARMALHEMDHMFGILFTKRTPDLNHAVPLDAFSTVAEWADDWPSLEARSTFLYTLYTPPLSFVPDAVVDADFMDRKFEKRIYPGMEMEGVMTLPATDDERRHYSELWKRTKQDLDELSNTRTGAAQQGQPSSDKPSKLKEVTTDVAQEAEAEATRDQPLF